jgi:hypothetical protein
MRKQDKKWHVRCEQLVEFKQKNGHWEVPRRCGQDESLGGVG